MQRLTSPFCVLFYRNIKSSLYENFIAKKTHFCYEIFNIHIEPSPSGKVTDFDSAIRRFKSYRLSHWSKFLYKTKSGFYNKDNLFSSLNDHYVNKI